MKKSSSNASNASEQYSPYFAGNGALSSASDSSESSSETCSATPPKDRYHFVYITLILHGIGILMPWNMFINANAYFTDKLTVVDEEMGQALSNSTYVAYFLSYLGLAAQIPNVLCSLLNVFVQFASGRFQNRILGGILAETAIIVMTIVLAVLDTTAWTSTFFYLTMGSVVVLNIANGVYQNTLWGIASRLPEYSNAVVLGTNCCGTFVSLVNWLSISASPNKQTAAIFYFSSALAMLLLCLVSYIALPYNRFFAYYVLDQQQLMINGGGGGKTGGEECGGSKTVVEIAPSSRPPYWLVMKSAWPQCLNVFLVFFVTLSVFPVITADIEPVSPLFLGGSLQWTERYFTALCCFLVFNASALFGNFLPRWFQFPGPNHLWIAVVLRLLFIPFFLMANFAPATRIWPVLINSDVMFVVGQSLLGLTTGYFCSLCMIYAPSSVEAKHSGTAGMMAAASLVMGIFAGVNFSALMAWLVKR
ncbi:Nucleoside transmembrane transporter [Tyrophagus putrescentiae]|nr:Nucleoside transmembrane transporter [Tyrophagus putrescentiae]